MTHCLQLLHCHWWEVYSLHVSILHWSDLDSGKPSKCHVCFYDFVLPSCLLSLFKCDELVMSCCIVECCASLDQTIYLLSLLSPARAAEICGQLSEEKKGDVTSWSLTSSWRHVKRTGSQICLSLSEKIIAVTFVLNNAFSCDWGHWKCLTCCD